MRSTGGTLILGGINNSLEACKTYCLDDNTCLGLDWVHDGINHGERCWLLKDEASVSAKLPADGIDQYVLQREC